jgi:BirA family biotin operon repressor/biotin-[acetyl-CoA-carboxylase] ligase
MVFALGPKALTHGYRLASYDTIGSTSAEARQRALGGDPGRLWIVAEEQTAGHGRRGSSWQTPRGNLAASLLVLLPDAPGRAATLGFVAGLALEQAIRSVASECASMGDRGSDLTSPLRGGRNLQAEGAANFGRGAALLAQPPPETDCAPLTGFDLPSRARLSSDSELRLKWPNDVLVGGAKVAGILLEAIDLRPGQNAIVVGIGVNVRHAPEGAPYPTTSLAARGGVMTPQTLFGKLSEAWIEQEAVWNGSQGFAAVRQRWLERAAGLGAPIAVRSGEDVYRGTFETIDEEGRLVVRSADGAARVVSAGEVHFGAAATATS